MAGVQLQLTADSEGLRRALAALVAAGVDLREPMDEIGAALLTSTQQRFLDEETPAGEAWPELAPGTKERPGPGGRPRGGDHMLRVKGHLFGSLTYLADRTAVQLGSVRVYAALHQLGGTDDMPRGPADVPAREFLGLSREDEEEITNILSDHLRGPVS